MIAASPYMVVFRILHIVAGVFWVGSLYLFVVYLSPAADAIAPAGAPLMAELLGKRRMVDGIIALGSITVIAGLFLYWHDWHQYASLSDWLNSNFGGILTFGMICAIAALAIGGSIVRPNVRRFLALGRQVHASGAPPTPETGAEMAAIQKKLKRYSRVAFALLVVAVIMMSTARYA